MTNIIYILFSISLVLYAMNNFLDFRIKSLFASRLYMFMIYASLFYGVFLENLLVSYIVSILILYAINIGFFLNYFAYDLEGAHSSLKTVISRIISFLALVPLTPMLFALPVYNYFPNRFTLLGFVVVSFLFGMILSVSDNIKNILLSTASIVYTSKDTITFCVSIDEFDEETIEELQFRFLDIKDFLEEEFSQKKKEYKK